jgi:hypothetical protein
MYGNALKEASVAYYTENNSIVSDYKTLKINYKGKSVSCDVTINYDGTIYLKNCTVAGTSVQNKTYGTYSPYTPYLIGDEVTYNDVKYYVIANSGVKESTVTLLKAEPLTVEEVNTYGTGHVNMYNARSGDSYYHQAYDSNGYGGMAYYTSTTCGYNGSKWVYDGCKTNYAESEIKYVVDAWAADKFTSTDLREVEGYKARLVQKEELRSQFYSSCSESATYCSKESTTPSWLYNSKYWYWAMSQYHNSSSHVWYVNYDGNLYSLVYSSDGAVRPVINLYKSKL